MPRTLFAAIATVSIVGIGFSLIYALLSIQLAERGFSGRAIGLHAAASGVSTLLGAPFVPAWGARLGVRSLLMAALAGSALCLLAFAATEGFWIWLVIRLIYSLALTVLFVMSEYWINASAPPHKRGLAMGLYAMSLASGFAVGPTLLAITGTNGFLPYVAAVALFAMAGSVLFIAGRDAPSIVQGKAEPVISFLFAVPAATLAALLHGALETANFTLLPVYALRDGLSAETGARLVSLFALANVLSQLPIGLLADRIDKRKLLFALGVCGLVGALVLAGIGTGRFALFCTLLFVWSGLVGGFYIVGLAHLGARFAGPRLASANAAYIMLYSAGTLIGPPAIGLGLDVLVPQGFFLTIALLLAAYVGIVAWRLRASSGKANGLVR